MNCTHWEERIALYAGGDLSAAESAQVVRHLGECPECRMFAAGLRESLELLQDAAREPVAPAHFAAVRARVLSQLEQAPRAWWRSTWLYGVAAAAAVLLLLAALRPPAPASAPPRHLARYAPPVSVEAAPPVPLPPVAPAVHHSRRRPRVIPAVVRTDPGPPIVVKLLTDDPDVVIYWITDKSGE